MSKFKSLFVLGILTAIMPFLGFPRSWRTFFIMVMGLFIALLAFLAYKEKRTAPLKKLHKKNTVPRGLTFVESPRPESNPISAPVENFDTGTGVENKIN